MLLALGAALLGFDSTTHLEPLNSVAYHQEIKLADNDPLLIAYLNETDEAHETYEAVLDRAAPTFDCLTPTATRLMLSGVESRAAFIASEDGLAMPALVHFSGGKSRATFGGEWSEAALAAWAFSSIAGVTLVEDDESLEAVAPIGEVAVVAFVAELCDEQTEEFAHALMELRRGVAGAVPAAMSTNVHLARAEGFDDGVGVVVRGARGSRSRFPADKLDFSREELKTWMDGILSAASPKGKKKKKSKVRVADERYVDEL